MSAAREKILNRIRAAVGRDADGITGIDVARDRIRLHERQIEPAFDDDPAERFCARLEAAHATVARIDALAQAPAELTRYLDNHDAGVEVVIGGDDWLQQVDWPDSIRLHRRVAAKDDRASLTTAVCGIAETGTLMLVSGPQNPVSLNFLPDFHIVALRRDQLLPRMEDAWDRLREQFGELPRAVNFISGPSKTADVEQTVEYGAHGPRCLHVMLIG